MVFIENGCAFSHNEFGFREGIYFKSYVSLLPATDSYFGRIQ